MAGSRRTRKLHCFGWNVRIRGIRVTAVHFSWGALHTSIADLRPRADANSSLRPGKPPLSAEPDPPPELGINQRDFPADEIVRGLGAEIDDRGCRMLDGR